MTNESSKKQCAVCGASADVGKGGFLPGGARVCSKCFDEYHARTEDEPRDIADLLDRIDKMLHRYNRDSGSMIVTNVTFKIRKSDGVTALTFRVDPRTSVAIPCGCGGAHKYKAKQNAMVCKNCGDVIEVEEG